MNKKQAITKYIFQSGVGAGSNCGFSHHSSVLADMNALRNALRNMYQPLVCHEAVDFQQVQILPKQFAVHLEELQTDKSVRAMLKLCILK